MIATPETIRQTVFENDLYHAFIMNSLFSETIRRIGSIVCYHYVMFLTTMLMAMRDVTLALLYPFDFTIKNGLRCHWIAWPNQGFLRFSLHCLWTSNKHCECLCTQRYPQLLFTWSESEPDLDFWVYFLVLRLTIALTGRSCHGEETWWGEANLTLRIRKHCMVENIVRSIT